MNKQIFITYSWDSNEHKEWVRKLADKLIENGVNVFLDQYDILPGESFTHFMEKSISNSDKVLVILTPNYKEKSIERKGGVGYEQQIISGEIMSGIERKKFIPLIRRGKYEDGVECAIPPHFKGISTLDFRVPENENEVFDELLRTIYNEPKLIKPSLGEKPDFGKQKSIPSFVIKLDKDFRCTQTEIILTDLFLQISDLRKSNSQYNLFFDIEGITHAYEDYQQLVNLKELSDKEMEKKIQLRNDLNRLFFLPNGTLYDYLNYCIVSIIDLSFNKYKYISNLEELTVSIQNSIQLFSNRNKWKRESTKFDVFHNKIKWGFSIWISEKEVELLLAKFSVKDKFFLTSFAGLDTYDLMHSTLIEEVIPKESYQFTIDYFSKRISSDLKEECFKISDWRIGLG